MIIKEYGKFRSICDVCGETLPLEDSFNDAVEAKKSAKWKTVLDSGEYIDICPNCKDCED